MQGVLAQVTTGAQSARSAFLVADGNVGAVDQFATLNGRSIRMSYGWPAATADGIGRTVDVSFTAGQLCGGTSGCFVWVHSGASGSCNAIYQEPTGAGQPPQFSSNTLEC